MKCPYCSQEMPDNSASCEHCGGTVIDPRRAIPAAAKPSDVRLEIQASVPLTDERKRLSP